jgi:hypothetical protein
MDDHTRLTIKIGHARQVERILLLLGWATVALGIIAAVACVLFWATGDLTTERAIGILLGVSFVAILSGATAYGSGINVGLGAERLALAAKAAATPAGEAGPAGDRPPRFIAEYKLGRVEGQRACQHPGQACGGWLTPMSTRWNRSAARAAGAKRARCQRESSCRRR